MTIQVALPTDVQHALDDEAERQGMTPEGLAAEILRQRFDGNGRNGAERHSEADHSASHSVDVEAPRNLAEFLGCRIGAIASSEYVPGGARLSENTGEKFTEMLLEEHRRKSQ